MAKKVFISGASKGIGLGIACAFANAGYDIYINARKKEPLEDAKAKIISLGAYCQSFSGDISDYSFCELIFKEMGHIDVLINNAGTAYYGLFSDMSPKDWNFVLNTNLNSVFNCTKLAIPGMLSKKKGAIINISSIWGSKGASFEAVYSASKGAVNSFTKAMAKELGPSGIRVNAIACGVIDTDMIGHLDKDERSLLIDEIPLGRFGTTKDVGNLAVFLAQEEYITGKIIGLDGGM